MITAEQHDVLIGLAKGRFYPERSYAAMLYDADEHGLPAEVLAAP